MENLVAAEVELAVILPEKDLKTLFAEPTGSLTFDDHESVHRYFNLHTNYQFSIRRGLYTGNEVPIY